MSKVLRKQRLIRAHHRPNKMYKKGATKFPKLIKGSEEAREGIITEIVHEQGRNAPLAMVTMVDTQEGMKKEKIVLVASEGMYTGKAILFGGKAPMELGNTLQLKYVPDGTIMCSVERLPGDGGSIAKTSGSYVSIVGYNPEKNEVRIKLPSGVKKVISGESRGTIGIIASGGVHEKPLLKASRAYFKYKARGQLGAWPRVRGVAMNPVDHMHGGGNHQHIGRSSCVARGAPSGQKVGQIAARRTGCGRSKTKRFE
ncbi:large subunit ribosomal protein L8e [Nematocida sp. LUAm3]|nr:large subunit ribosomal protein L8e [Nematocida sp. LUAm3]KAI5176012.1 large subunit ribosomal protein L8e [Nematocida sp. LUAm2]KAI5179109.1 large subunit ribosomal protein L8e [Nematocida sp. LUAm1]